MTEHEHKCPSCGSKAAAGIGYFKREECLRKSYQKAVGKLRDMLKHNSIIVDDVEVWIDEQTLWWKKGVITHTIPLEAAIDILKAMRLHEEY